MAEVCKLNGDGTTVRFTWKEWCGMFAMLVTAATAPLGILWFHANDGERHQTEREKTELIRALLKEEREIMLRELDNERRLFMSVIEAHAGLGGHPVMENRFLEHVKDDH